MENKFLVGVAGDAIVVLRPSSQMTKAEALLHAAWLVALADDNNEFSKILEAVQNT